MKEELRIYLESLINDIPNYVYECLLSFFLFRIGYTFRDKKEDIVARCCCAFIDSVHSFYLLPNSFLLRRKGCKRV